MEVTVIQSEQLSLIGLIKKYERIVIPILQRDYAQGRKGEEELRQNFLAQLKGFLESEDSFHDLDFVYGNIENNPSRFIPLDGQQRLTTLFLLHYYLSLHDGVYSIFQNTFGIRKAASFESRFSYETRDSSISFCDAILNNGIDLSNLEEPDIDKNGGVIHNELTKTLKNFGWFIASWEFDPTIDSMLRMLDAIHQAFKVVPVGLYTRLVSEESPAITFRELPMKDNGLNEDLYVKMNSRGLPLTRFEKIKAKIIQTLKESQDTRLLSRSSSEKERVTQIASYFSYKIDTVWSYMFWPYRTEREIIKTIGDYEDKYTIKEIDPRLLNFIAAVAANYEACNKGVKELDLKLLDEPEKCSWASLSSLGNEFFTHLVNVLDAFSRTYDNSGIIPYVDDSSIDIKGLFEGLLRAEYKDRVYDLRCLFFAYYSFMIQNRDVLSEPKTSAEMKDWSRVVTNLVRSDNNRYDSETDFCNVISFIDELLSQSKVKGILSLLASNNVISPKGVDQRQFKEERIKAWLICNDRSWYDTITEAECNEYLTGQIISLLVLSGIEEEYDKYMKGESYSITERHLLDFKYYSGLMNQLFVKVGLNPEYEHKQLFRRALLSMGDYSMIANSNSSLLNNGSRDVSWKRYLHQTHQHLTQLKQLLVPGITGLKSYLENVIAERSVNDLNDWMGMLVTAPEMWSIMDWYNAQSRRFIRFWGAQGYNRHMYPLKHQRMSGDHYEMRTLYRYYTLKSHSLFADKEIAVRCTYSDDEEPYIKLGNGTIQLCIYFNYQEEHPWRIELWKEDEQEISTDIQERAVDSGYSIVTEESGRVFHLDKTITDGELESELQDVIGKDYFLDNIELF